MPMYPALPYHKMPYDRDGSIGFYFISGTSSVTQLTSSSLINWNDNDSTYATNFGNTTYLAGLIFPEFRDIEAILIRTDTVQVGSYNFQTSEDTTNGYDGTWVTRVNDVHYNSSFPEAWWRGLPPGSNPLPVAVQHVKAVRYTTGSYQYAFHVFGRPSAGENPNRLEIWDPVADQRYFPGNNFDMGSGGDVTRGVTYTKTFRVKNIGGVTLNNINVGIENLGYDVSPAIVPQFMVGSPNYNAGVYANPIVIPSLAAGATSDVITLRYIAAANAQTRPVGPRLYAVPV